MEWLEGWFNFDLTKHPLNWLIVGVFATIWLLLFHVVMMGFGALSNGKQASFNAPGQINIAPDNTAAFATPGSTLNGGLSAASNLSVWDISGGETSWTDGIEAKYAEDGWTGNGP